MAKNSLILFAIIIIISIFLKNEKFYLNTTNENKELNSKLVYFEDNRINDIEINFGKKNLQTKKSNTQYRFFVNLFLLIAFLGVPLFPCTEKFPKNLA